jgi:hypothetical protein
LDVYFVEKETVEFLEDQSAAQRPIHPYVDQLKMRNSRVTIDIMNIILFLLFNGSSFEKNCLSCHDEIIKWYSFLWIILCGG